MATKTVRAERVEESLAHYPIPLMDCHCVNGMSLPPSETASKFNIDAVGWGSGGLTLKGLGVEDTTEISTLCFEFILPPEYVAGADAKLNVRAKYEGDGTPGACTIDAQVYEPSDGAGGSDLCEDEAQSLTAAFADYAFTITKANLEPGDSLLVFVRTTIIETPPPAVLLSVISLIEMQLDMKG